MQRVAIVNAGEWGGLKRSEGGYDNFAEIVKHSLKQAKGVHGEERAEVCIVQNTAEALNWVMATGVIVYITRGMFGEAKKVAAEHRHVHVVLFTGLLPEGEVVFASKSWIHSSEQVQDHILSGW